MASDAETLVILTPGFPKDEKDTTCLPSQQLLIDALNRAFPRLQIIILSFEYPFSQEPYQWKGNRVLPFHGLNKGAWVKMKTYWRIWRQLKKINQQHQVLGILSFWCGECAWLGKRFARNRGLAFFAWILGQDARKGNKYVKRIMPRPEELIALSPFLAREFFSHYAIKPRWIIPNAVDETLFETVEVERDIDLLGVGSLITLKHFDHFLAVVRQLSKRFPDLVCVICGEGPEHERLQQQIDAFHISHLVKLTGELPHPEVLKLMRRSRILLHPSEYEGYSTVCLEALYAGAQVISVSNPKDNWVRQWHIVTGVEEMAARATEILNDPQADHQPVMLYSMQQQARSLMKLFDYSDAATA